MKKIISIISAMALTAGMTASLAANALEVSDSDLPEFYFKAKETKGAEVLTGGAVYVNKKAADESGAVIASEIYLKDPKALSAWVVARWSADKAGIELKNLSGPVAKYGKAPYAKYTSDDDITNEFKAADGKAVLSAAYNVDVSLSKEDYKPLALSGDKSDSYPLACFDTVVGSATDFGSYTIGIYDTTPYFTTVTFRDQESITWKEFSPSDSLKSSNLVVNVSDRPLGDIDDNGKINATDATSILQAYANASIKKPTGLSAAEEAAADVNGDGKINAVDATCVLTYYAFKSTTGSKSDKSLNEYLKSE